MIYDFAVIGSGPSGGRVIYELAKAGVNCVLIEAGPHIEAPNFPENEMDYSCQLFWGGGLEVNTSGKLGFLRARLLGGTSIVNQALLDEFDEIAWNDFRAQSKVSFFNVDSMAPHYAALKEATPMESIDPKNFNKNTKIFCQGLDKLGFQWKPLTRAQKNCAVEKGSDCITCLGGCNREAKQSSLITTVRKALKDGAKLEAGFEVQEFLHSQDVIKIYGLQKGEKKEIQAKKLVLAGGSFGNTQLLLRSGFKNKLPALGKNFSCHPQYMTYAWFNEPIDAHKGAFQGVKSFDPKLRAQGFKFENVYAQPIGTAMLLPSYGRSHLDKMKRYRFLASMEVAIRDDAQGVMSVDRNGKLVIKKDLTDSDMHKRDTALDLVRGFFESAGAKEIYTAKQGFGLHLMGGCQIGLDGGTSVVSPEFRVHGTQNVFIADSSIFPNAPGINPSYSIMALSHKASQEMLK